MKSFFNDLSQHGNDYYLTDDGKGKKDEKEVIQDDGEEVNDIIMKIELKKFQKLIENRIQKKNALLKADIKRMYPMCYHQKDKMLSDEFRPELDSLQGYKLTSPKEEMMKTAKIIQSDKFERTSIPSSMMWKRFHEVSRKRNTQMRIGSSDAASYLGQTGQSRLRNEYA